MKPTSNSAPWMQSGALAIALIFGVNANAEGPATADFYVRLNYTVRAHGSHAPGVMGTFSEGVHFALPREQQETAPRCQLRAKDSTILPAGTVLGFASCQTRRDSSWRFYRPNESQCQAQAQALKGRCLGKHQKDWVAAATLNIFNCNGTPGPNPIDLECHCPLGRDCMSPEALSPVFGMAAAVARQPEKFAPLSMAPDDIAQPRSFSLVARRALRKGVLGLPDPQFMSETYSARRDQQYGCSVRQHWPSADAPETIKEGTRFTGSNCYESLKYSQGTLMESLAACQQAAKAHEGQCTFIEGQPYLYELSNNLYCDLKPESAELAKLSFQLICFADITPHTPYLKTKHTWGRIQAALSENLTFKLLP